MMNRNLELTIVCPFCGKLFSVAVREEDYTRYQNGALVQNAFPYLTATEREALVSGMCPDCQGVYFGEEYEEDDWEGEDIELITLDDDELESALARLYGKA